MKNKYILLLIAATFISSCQPSQTAVQTAIAETQAAIPTTTLTPTAAPTQTPIPTSTPLPWWNNCLVANTITSTQYDLLLSNQKEVCIYGVITDKSEVKDHGYIINIFPKTQTQILYLIIANNDAYMATKNIILNNDPVLTTIGKGDCIIVYGFPTHSYGNQFIATLVIDPVRLALEAKDSSVQTIISTCK